MVYSGAEFKGRQARYDQSGQPNVLPDEESRQFGKVTRRTWANCSASSSISGTSRRRTIQGVILDSGEIHGSFTEEQTVPLANELNAGALPVPMTIVENETVGPTLGKIDLGSRSPPRCSASASSCSS